MVCSFVVLALCRLVQLVVLLCRSERSKELEILVLRHERRATTGTCSAGLLVFHARARIPDPPGRRQTRSIRCRATGLGRSPPDLRANESAADRVDELNLRALTEFVNPTPEVSGSDWSSLPLCTSSS